MANRSTNRAAVPEAKGALDKFKYEVASELGVPLTDGYNGDLTSRQNGSVGGYMVKKMIEHQKADYGWEFLFIGANIDAVETAARFGIERNRAVNYNADSQGTQILYETLSAPICAMRADAAISDDWSQNIEEDYKNRK